MGNKYLNVLICTAALMAASTSHASTSIVFSNDSAKVMLSSSGDSDAANLFAAMNAPVLDDGTHYAKEVIFTKSGQTMFSVSCSIARSDVKSGSCVMEIYLIDGMVFDPANSEVIQSTQGIADATNAGKLFSKPDNTGIIYFSADGHLGISLDYDGGYPELFMVQYK